MSDTELKSLIEQGNKTIAAIRGDLDAVKASDALAKEKLAKMEADLASTISAKAAAEAQEKALAEMKARIDELETAANRPGAGKGSAADAERKSLMIEFVKSGSPEALAKLEAMEAKAADTRVSTPASGGVAVPEVLAAEILRPLQDLSPLRSISRKIALRNENWRQVVDLGGATANWVGETDARTKTDAPNFGEVTLAFGEMSAEPEATTKAINDLIIDVDAWLTMSISERFARAEGLAFVSGDGVNKPRGFLAGPAATAQADADRAFGTLQFVASGAAANLGANPYDVLHNTIYALKAGYRAGAGWVLNSATLASLARVKDDNGQYLLQPAISAATGDRLLGYGTTVAEDMPNVAADATPIAFGNFQEGYLIGDIAGLFLLRDPYTKSGYVKFKASRRVGGGLLDSQAIKLVKISA
jgi:HK97 family phage major capsid protein